MGQSPGGFGPRDSSARSRPSSTLHVSDGILTAKPRFQTQKNNSESRHFARLCKEYQCGIQTATHPIRPGGSTTCFPVLSFWVVRLSAPRGTTRAIERLKSAMTDTRRNDHPDPLRQSFDAASEVTITRTSGLPRRRPVHVGVWMGRLVARRAPLVIALWRCAFSLAALIRRTEKGLCTRGVLE